MNRIKNTCQGIVLLLVASIACGSCKTTIVDATLWQIKWKRVSANIAKEEDNVSADLFNNNCRVSPGSDKDTVYVTTPNKELYKIKRNAAGITLELIENNVADNEYIISDNYASYRIELKGYFLHTYLLDGSKVHSTHDLSKAFGRDFMDCKQAQIAAVHSQGDTHSILVQRQDNGALHCIMYSTKSGPQSAYHLTGRSPIERVDGFLSMSEEQYVALRNEGIVSMHGEEITSIKGDGLSFNTPNALFVLAAKDLPQERKVVIASTPSTSIGFPQFYYLTPKGEVMDATKELPEEVNKVKKTLILPFDNEVYVLGTVGENQAICYCGSIQGTSKK